MSHPTLHKCPSITGLDIAKIEELYTQLNGAPVKYVMDTSIKNTKGNWSDQPVALFYCEKRHEVSDSHYFVIYCDLFDSLSYVANGQSAVDHTYTGLVLNNEIYYSRYRHDFRQVGPDTIDGGLDYVRLMGCTLPIVRFNIVDGQCIVVE